MKMQNVRTEGLATAWEEVEVEVEGREEGGRGRYLVLRDLPGKTCEVEVEVSTAAAAEMMMMMMMTTTTA
jgi:hypothetical protein